MVELSLANIGLILVLLGFVVALIAVFLLVFRARGITGHTKGGGILFIGPIPIIFGSDKESVRVLVILAIVLMVIVLIFMLIPTFLLSR